MGEPRLTGVQRREPHLVGIVSGGLTLRKSTIAHGIKLTIDEFVDCERHATCPRRTVACLEELL